MTACSLVLLSASALAESSLGREDVEQFCAATDRAAPPSAGIQFDGAAADDRIMTRAGGGLIGGCSREQLSEVMAKNGLDASLLTH